MNKKLYLLIILTIALTPGHAQQYPIYYSSGEFTPPDNWNQANASSMTSVANTNRQIATAIATGNSYFRFFSALSGGTIYEPEGSSDSLIFLSVPFNLQVNTTIYKAYYFSAVNTTDNYVFKTTGSGSPGTARAAVIRVQGPIDSVVSLARYPAGNIYAGQNVTIYATISDTFSPGQGAYLRYSLDKWATSTVLPMTGSGTTYSAVIPGSANTTGAVPIYYVFTSGDSLTIAPTDADLMTINLYNDSFQNFTYTVNCDEMLGNTNFQMVQTDKARYNPGDEVQFTATFTGAVPSGVLTVQYWHLNDSLTTQTFNLSQANQYSWTWTPPGTDFQGYLAVVKLIQGGATIDSTSIGIDVSSKWNKFPRYGFLSAYPYTDSSYRQLLFSNLNRYHLNGLQFYDVNHKHDVPLAGTVANPDTIWTDIANRSTYLSTVLSYIQLAHACNMKAMDYNLLYGAYSSTAVADGVSPQWGIYYDASHQYPVVYTLPAGWATPSLQVEDPADTGWEDFIFTQENNLFGAIPYDGWHVDQLGSQGTVYDYFGNSVNLAATFGPYLQDANAALDVPLVMNAVTNYGQQGIAAAPVDFLYTEVWPPYTTYNSFAALMDSNNFYGNNQLATVFAAYIDIGISNSPGYFNPAAVLLADAAIFAVGGAHIEMGDHLLCNSYFPNNNLVMTCSLQENLVHYYDFLVAYENLLRDSVNASPVTLQTTGVNQLSDTAATGKIWVLNRMKGNTQVFHLINLTAANTLQWNDPADNQPVPDTLVNIPLSFTTDSAVTAIFAASPDWNNGVPVALAFTQTGNTVSLTLPFLNYWTMITVQSQPQVATAVTKIEPAQDVTVYPNPFADEVNFRVNTGEASQVTIRVTDEVGQVVSQMPAFENTGVRNITVSLPGQSKGVYFWEAEMVNSQNVTNTIRGKLVHL